MIQQNAALTGTFLLLLGLLNSPVAEAFNFGDMMNPSRWFGGDRERDDYYHDGPWGPGYGPGYYGAPTGYGAPAYPPPVYAPPGYGYAPPAYRPPAQTNRGTSSEIEQLKQRIEQLEEEQAASQATIDGSQAGSYAPMATEPGTAYSPPAAGQATSAHLDDQPKPGPAASSATGYTSKPQQQSVPMQGSVPHGQPQPKSGSEWLPSGYYHPAMQ